MPQVARSAEGRPISSKEVVVILRPAEIGSDGIAMSPGCKWSGRGSVAAQTPRFPNRRRGECSKWGAREIVVECGITNRFAGAQIGQQIKLAATLWTVVGIFDLVAAA